jgi:hypothetical protein
MVLRLREDALKKSLSKKGKKGDAGDDDDANAELAELRKLAECPPEVIRMRMEMTDLRARMEQLEAENGKHPAKGKMTKVRSIHWSPYDRVGGVNADP